jgi:hypothetical protein
MVARVSRLPDVEVTVDLDAIRAASTENEPTKTFRLGGQVFTVPPKMPVYVGILMSEGKIQDALRTWLGDEQEATFAQLGVNDDEFGALFKGLYGVDAGESSASPAS